MRTAEYGDPEVKSGKWSDESTIDVRTKGRREYRLIHSTPGWQPAGSMARYKDTESWGVIFNLDGARNGRHFKTLAEARAIFDAWTSPAQEVLPLKA